MVENGAAEIRVVENGAAEIKDPVNKFIIINWAHTGLHLTIYFVNDFCRVLIIPVAMSNRKRGLDYTQFIEEFVIPEFFLCKNFLIQLYSLPGILNIVPQDKGPSRGYV